jgi:hypothetical protein
VFLKFTILKLFSFRPVLSRYVIIHIIFLTKAFNSLIKAEELFLGDPLKVVLSVANDGNILIKAPLYLRIDVHNFTSFGVSSMKLSILEKKNFTCVGPEGNVFSFYLYFILLFIVDYLGRSIFSNNGYL